ncbi:MAG: type II secretion system protein GspJ [Brevundimonas sp.]|uniref:type II secretion system minor pseudopilin GspJ n=1 Tax=Brevundimonas sp. TaxID=1871086 RepID=UPI001217020B|nr:type II secretion system minor pseudopilin GspJ [Brevundimonas sp.]RZJ18042.1 MAG: type II secretion system protein GspJ [Brevundimonas sp.]
MKTRAGFTLVEVLISLLIFALIAGAGAALLAVASDNRLAVRAASDRTADLQRLRALLAADLSQASGRRTRDERGVRAFTALATGQEADGALLRLTRAGWSNPGDAPRASMQTVEYRLVENRLERRFRARLDGARWETPQVLYRGVSNARVAFIDEGQERPDWVGGSDDPLPDAVRLDLTLDGYGPMTQLFLVGAGR